MYFIFIGLYKRRKALKVYSYGPIGDEDDTLATNTQQDHEEDKNNMYNDQIVNADERTPLIKI